MARMAQTAGVAALALGAMVVRCSVPAFGSPFWIAWEGDDWPESVGYTRSWGNWDGPHQGGAIRTLENGVLTYDSLYDPGVWDSYYMENLPLTVGPGEMAVMEWRLKVDQSYSGGDPGVALGSEDGWMLGLAYAEDHIISDFENYLEIPFTPYVWHDFRVLSPNLRVYDLFIDGALVHQGTFGLTFPGSIVGFGDVSQNFFSGSLHSWDYYRVGVIVPEPGAAELLLLMWVMAWRVARRG